jgi:hypothetical protein
MRLPVTAHLQPAQAVQRPGCAMTPRRDTEDKSEPEQVLRTLGNELPAAPESRFHPGSPGEDGLEPLPSVCAFQKKPSEHGLLHASAAADLRIAKAHAIGPGILPKSLAKRRRGATDS